MGYVMAQYYANETVLYIVDWRKILKSNLDFNEHDNSNSTSETVNVVVSFHTLSRLIIWFKMEFQVEFAALDCQFNSKL